MLSVILWEPETHRGVVFSEISRFGMITVILQPDRTHFLVRGDWGLAVCFALSDMDGFKFEADDLLQYGETFIEILQRTLLPLECSSCIATVGLELPHNVGSIS